MATATASRATNGTLQLLEAFGKPASIDKDAGIVRGVKVLGLTSQNGYDYLPQAVKSARQLYEGVKVNIDHPKKPGESRSVRDGFGVMRNPSINQNGELIADLHFNPKSDFAEAFIWSAENSPSDFGFSHNADGKRKRQANGRTVVESIDKVFSVDLVRDPATTTSLFESKENDMELAEQVADLSRQLTEQKASLDKLAADNKTLTEENATLKAAQAKAAFAAKVDGFIAEAKVENFPATIRDLLVESNDEAKAKAAIADAAKTLKAKPVQSVSGGAHLSESKSTGDFKNITDSKSFVSAMTRR